MTGMFQSRRIASGIREEQAASAFRPSSSASAVCKFKPFQDALCNFADHARIVDYENLFHLLLQICRLGTNEFMRLPVREG